MSRILAIDYGKKRCGLAVTDPMQLIAGGLATIPTHELIPYLKKYIQREPVELFVVGDPKSLDGTATDATPLVEQCIRSLKKHFSGIGVRKLDERFTSKLAFRSMIDSGLKKMQRRDKALVDEVSATILLQDYLEAAAGGGRLPDAE
ncbi:Holliday junction resolvase RuvX [Compostibacter hankyongensis]|uniref:Putative pre-16S rRNA nuclease n=1 Tax=Compostibacter hankyongensis TaxID=1007089 RepID=A0ABP8FHM2_9BACT